MQLEVLRLLGAGRVGLLGVFLATALVRRVRMLA
jgi:hypothetical protein